MKAIVMHSFGGPEVLEAEETPAPSPREDEVLIKVKAAGVNPVDYKIRSGSYVRKETKLPTILGRDVSGIIESVGTGIEGLQVGDEVYAFLASHSGGYAGFAIARENEVALKPTSLDYAHAAAVPLAAITAWQALFDYGRMKRGQRVLIHGAAGGVGHLAVQFAKAKGATVVATAASQDLQFVRELGADQVIDYKKQSFENETEDIDLVIDLVAGDTQKRSWQVLKQGGAIVSTLEQPSLEEAAKRRARAQVFMANPKPGQLAEIAQLIDDWEIQVVVQKIYDLEDAAQAQDELENSHSAGKRVLTVA